MIYLIIYAVIITILLILSIIWGLKRGKKVGQMKKNINVLLDHEQTDERVRKIQNAVKKKIIEAPNEKKSDEAINHLFAVVNRSKL